MFPARRLHRSHPAPSGGAGALAAVASTPVGRVVLRTGFLGLLALADVGLRGVVPDRTYLIALYTIGLLHFVYDAVIRRTRTPPRPATPSG